MPHPPGGRFAPSRGWGDQATGGGPARVPPGLPPGSGFGYPGVSKTSLRSRTHADGIPANPFISQLESQRGLFPGSRGPHDAAAIPLLRQAEAPGPAGARGTAPGLPYRPCTTPDPGRPDAQGVPNHRPERQVHGDPGVLPGHRRPCQTGPAVSASVAPGRWRQRVPCRMRECLPGVEFRSQYAGALSVRKAGHAPADCRHFDNCVRPHYALALMTTVQYLQQSA